MSKDELLVTIQRLQTVKVITVVDHQGKMWDIGGVLAVGDVAQIQLMELVVEHEL